MTQLTHSTHSPASERKLIEDVYGVLGILRRGWRYIVVSLLVCLTVAALYLAQVKPLYKATARLLILDEFLTCQQ